MPQPGIAELEQLVAAGPHGRAAGRPRGRGRSRRPASRGVQLAAYRIVQEALTNTLKHAGPDAAADVRVLRVNGTGWSVEFATTAPAAPAGAAWTRPAGMRERAAVFGGTVDAGPAQGGGWQVRARLTVEPVPR